ncbi:MAG: hypothetical protein Q4D56_05940 [Bacteroides sp.]|nr:hypothetical protein [Bacteroides sp.]
MSLLVVTIVSVLVVFFVIVSVFSIHLDGGVNWTERLWTVYYNFTDPGNQREVQGWGNRIVVGIISLSGSILLGGLLISTISNIIERRVEVVRAGLMTYRHIAEHYVLIGFNELTVSIIIELHRANPSTRILLMSGLPSETVRHIIQSELPHEMEKNVCVYFGNIESEEELRRLHIDRACEVYVLGDQDKYGRDSKNVATVHKVSMLRGKGAPESIMPVYVQFDGIPSYSNIQKMNLPSHYYCVDDTPNIYFRPFNLHENWARWLWSFHAADTDMHYDPLDYRPIQIVQNEEGHWVASGQDFVHLVIVGFNRMGRSLLLEALRICHYANYDDSLPTEQRIRTHITLVDKKMDEMRDYFKAQFPYIDSQIDDIVVDYCQDDICSESMRARLSKWMRDEHRMLTVAICVSEPDLSLSLGLNLPLEVYQGGARVLIRQSVKTDYSSMIDGDEGRYKYVKVFGMLNEGMRKSILNDVLASYVHLIYDKCYNNHLQQKDILKELYTACRDASPRFAAMNQQAQLLWYYTDEYLRWANRYQLDAYIVYCRTMGFGIRKVSPINLQLNDKPFNEGLSSEALRILIRMEKHRWNAERSVAGWKSGPVRDNNFFIHPLIIPFGQLEKLHPQDVEKDADVIHNLPYVLALGGYELYKM